MNKFKIEKDVPIPPKRAGEQSGKYPFDDMEVGDSFLVPLEGEDVKLIRRRLFSSIYNYKKRNKGKNMTTRVEEEGIRIWRVE